MTGKELGATFFTEKKPIDGVWASPKVEVVGACVMPVGYDVGDHRMFIIDFRGKEEASTYNVEKSNFAGKVVP